MYSQQTKTQFIELRARGRTIRDIAKQLNVPASTLGVWNREHRPDIIRLRALQWEELEDQFSRTLEDDLKALAARIRKWEDELDILDPCYHKVSEINRRSSRSILSVATTADAPSVGRLPSPGASTADTAAAADNPDLILIRTDHLADLPPRAKSNCYPRTPKKPAPALLKLFTPDVEWIN